MRMLHRLLHICLVAIAAILVGGAASACPQHDAASQPRAAQPSADAADARVTRDTPPQAQVSSASARRRIGSAGTVAAKERQGQRVADLAYVSEAATHGRAPHNCCGTAACGHVGACAADCCAAAPATLLSSGSQPGRKIVLLTPKRPAVSLVVIANRPSWANGEAHRRRLRDAEALRRSVSEPRLAQIARLTI